jgi:hypothetical protein
VFEGLVDAVGGADVEALHAEIGGAAAMGHFDAGEHADQLLGAAGRVAGGDGDGFDAFLAAGRDGGLDGGEGFGLVVLDADQHLFVPAACGAWR